jgi:hypothetical protein
MKVSQDGDVLIGEIPVSCRLQEAAIPAVTAFVERIPVIG